VDQAVLAAREADAQEARLTNVVYMGMGEPMQNLDEVLDSAATINAPEGLGLSARRIAISTVGWVPGIARLAEHPLPVRLAVSLHAADDATRSELMPINARYPIASLLAACTRYCDSTGRRVFIEYLLLEGVNDSPAHSKELAHLLNSQEGPGGFHVNLIAYNPTGTEYTRSSDETVRRFMASLERQDIATSYRVSRAQDISGACGQLAAPVEAARRRQREEKLARMKSLTTV
jgi:23S rRNA (adenine2503-C2)-methyltransferase